ncbi:MAG: hypothetical protein PVSMB1_14180 [Gemmatimonadaceae bacterium]
MLHGNADLAAWRVPWASELAGRLSAGVFLAEYRGYAGLPGPPSVAGVRLDARAAYAAMMKTFGCSPRDVILYGHSLGSAVATELAGALVSADLSATRPRALILESPFTSICDMARLLVGSRLARVWSLISPLPYDTEATVRALDVPVSVAHGDEDLAIPVWMGKRVYAAARRPGSLLVVDRAGHHDLATVAGDYWLWWERAASPM